MLYIFHAQCFWAQMYSIVNKQESAVGEMGNCARAKWAKKCGGGGGGSVLHLT